MAVRIRHKPRRANRCEHDIKLMGCFLLRLFTRHFLTDAFYLFIMPKRSHGADISGGVIGYQRADIHRRGQELHRP